MNGSEGRTKERGLILVAVLWIVASLSLLISAFNLSVRTGSAGTGNEIAMARARAYGDAGVEIAAARLAQEPEDGGWRADGRQYTTGFAGAKLRIAIFDANGLADLNKTDGEVIYGLLKQVTSTARQAAQIRDYIIEKRESTAKPAPAPSNQAQSSTETARRQAALGPPAFIDITQLRDAPGMSAGLYRSLRRLVTVHSSDGAINPLTARPELLLALPGMTHSDIARLDAIRAQTPSDKAIAALLPAPARKFVKARSGPAYTIIVSVEGAGLANRLETQMTIMTGGNGKAPYYALARRPGPF